MRVQPLVLATEWNVGGMSGSGIDGYLLSVYRIVKMTEPDPFTGLLFRIEYKVKDKQFANIDEADEYCLREGWLKVYVPKEQRCTSDTH